MPRPTPRPGSAQRPATIEVVHPIWLLKAIGTTILGALVCGYATLCLLFYQGQWQLILHPQRDPQPITQIAGIPATPIRFDAAESGQPRLSGAWLPADAPSRYAAYTVLYLRGGDRSLLHDPADAASIASLHSLGLNLFAFDYQGYGASDPTHPTSLRMTQDAAAALRYLTESRNIPEDRIIPYGAGLGASLATALAASHPGLPALVLESPGRTPIEIALSDPRTRALPVRTLFREDFSLESLATLPTPKFLISYSTQPSPPPPAFRAAATPKTTLELRPADQTQLLPALSRFLDQYLR